uniref:Uncharacterized protein n=1 Tax=Solanum tuberosum TaxID=4113 RepID=M1DHR1_SOLTU
MDINKLFASFSGVIPSKQSPSSKDKDGHRCCRSLVITEAKFGKPEAEAYTAHTFLRHAWISC